MERRSAIDLLNESLSLQTFLVVARPMIPARSALAVRRTRTAIVHSDSCPFESTLPTTVGSTFGSPAVSGADCKTDAHSRQVKTSKSLDQLPLLT